MSEVNNFIMASHPTLLARLAYIDKLLKKEKKYEGNDPETESDKTVNAKSNDHALSGVLKQNETSEA